MWAICFASIMKLLASLMLLSGFGLRFGPQNEQETSSLLFYAAFAIEFSPLILHCAVLIKACRRWLKNKLQNPQTFVNACYHSKRRCLFVFMYLVVGLCLVIAFRYPGTIRLSYEKGLAGLYCLCAAYQAFRTWRDLIQPTTFEMFGWFEVVFKNIIQLIAVHSWLLLTFVFVFYIEFNNFEGDTDPKFLISKSKFANCTNNIIQLNANATLIKDDPDILSGCMDFLQECSQTEPEAENAFNDWKVTFKVLSMAAGELTYDDLPFHNPITVFTFTLFTILVLFVIMNLMTSLAVNDIQDIRNQSRDGTWVKLMYTLLWYQEALPDWIQKAIATKPKEDKDINIISFKLNEVATLRDPRTWFNFFTRMPDSVSLKARGNGIRGYSSGKFTLTHDMEDFDRIVVIIGTDSDFTPKILKKGEKLEEKINFWRTQFAIVDFKSGYDIKRTMYRAQRYTASEENSHLEIKFKFYKEGKGGEFEVWEQTGDEKMEGKSQNYTSVKKPTEEIENTIIKQYKNIQEMYLKR